ncbi:hypothetical protein J53TS2_02130 [Paenibacillus sp. J53TS2]|nr:hypothetical protein J53TS2_02130 [Paenibacillus sp. J53TS2]
MRTGARKATGDQVKVASHVMMADNAKAKAKAKVAEIADRSSKTAALRQVITIMAAGTAEASAKAKVKAKVKAKARGKVREEVITTIMAAETKEVLTITETAAIIEITAVARADAAKARSSHHVRRSTIRRKRLSYAVR